MENNKIWTNGVNIQELGKFEFEYKLGMDSPYTFDIEGEKDWTSLVDNNNQGIWRYAPMLAISQSTVTQYSQHLAAELPKPIMIPELAQLFNVKEFYIIPCIYGKSGNFKDYEAAFVTGKLKDWGYSGPISFHSTGNTARAYHEYAINVGFESIAFLPLLCANKMIGATDAPENKICLYNGPFQELSTYAKKWAKQNGYLHIAPLRWKVEGKIPLGYHICEYLPQTTRIVQTIAGGYGIIGLNEAYKRLKQWHMIDCSPSFDLFQIEGSDTFAQIFPFGEDEISPDCIRVNSNSLEPTLQSTNPLSTYGFIRDICLQTGSRINSVEQQDILKYSHELVHICNKYDIPISFIDEKSPFISYAGMRKIMEQNAYDKDDVITFIITGSRIRTGRTPSNISIL